VTGICDFAELVTTFVPVSRQMSRRRVSKVAASHHGSLRARTREIRRRRGPGGAGLPWRITASRPPPAGEAGPVRETGKLVGIDTDRK
jgi:hypothetical protein